MRSDLETLILCEESKATVHQNESCPAKSDRNSN